MRGFDFAMALGVAVLVAGQATAQAPASGTKPAPAAAPKGPPPVPGVSAQGNAVIAKVQQQGDPVLAGAVQKMRALLPQVSQTALAPTIDVEKFAALLKQQDALGAQIQARRSELIVTILRQLPAADRGPFLKAIATRVPSQGQPPQGR